MKDYNELTSFERKQIEETVERFETEECSGIVEDSFYAVRKQFLIDSTRGSIDTYGGDTESVYGDNMPDGYT